MISTLDSPPLAGPVTCAVRAQGRVWMTLEALNELRRQPPPLPGNNLTVALLKHVDEQTLATLAALSQAIAQGGFSNQGFSDWGIVSAPRYLGRAAVASALHRFQAEGAWGVSPHLIPHRTLHSVSGTISQALKAHGPNFGVGGSPDSVGEPLLAALALLHSGSDVAGVWLTLSRQEPEGELGPGGVIAPGTGISALVLGLARTPDHPGELRLTVSGRPTPGREQARRPLGFDRFRELLDQAQPGAGPLTHELPEGGTIELARGREER